MIRDLSLDVRPGEKVGLVGPSGAGKSTLVNLLLRFYPLDRGRILIDGQDIAEVTQDSLRAAIGMVTQDTSLLHRSVRDNIRYGRPFAEEDGDPRAAAAARADRFIAGLVDPRGRTDYAAHVGERGVKLSGGQRQRIAIARVILKDAPILVLDEATAALDSEIEAAIQDSLKVLMRDKTVIAIAHRLSTIAAMDRLVVMDEGRIVEEGTHEALLPRGASMPAVGAAVRRLPRRNGSRAQDRLTFSRIRLPTRRAGFRVRERRNTGVLRNSRLNHEMYSATAALAAALAQPAAAITFPLSRRSMSDREF